MSVKEVSRPIIRYHGGKFMLAPWIISHFPEHRTYVEPYGGAASVLLRKKRCYAEVYNDLDQEIVNLFRVVREHGAEFQRQLIATPYSRDEYVWAWEPHESPLEQARRTVIRAFMGFASSSATKNRKGTSKKGGGPSTGFRARNGFEAGTHPARDFMNYADALGEITARLRQVVIENKDALEVMTQNDSEDTLHFCDPPYVPETRDAGTDYRHEMSSSQHRIMAEHLRELKGYVILSGYNSELYDELLGDWHKVQGKAKADGGGDRIECLWMNERAKQYQPQMQLF